MNEKIKQYLFVITIIVLTSCQNKQNDYAKILERVIDKNIAFCIQNNQIYLNQIDKYSLEWPTRTEQFKDDIIFMKSLGNDFINLTNKINTDNNNIKKNYENLLIEYEKTLGLFKDIKYSEFKRAKLKFIVENYSDNFYKNNINVMAKSMQNDILINKSKCYNLFIPILIGDDMMFRKYNIKSNTELKSNNNKTRCIICLENENIHMIYNLVFVDTIIKNGQMIKVEPIIEKSNIFSNLIFENLSKGNYQIKGRIKLLGEFGYSRELNYKHEFKLE